MNKRFLNVVLLSWFLFLLCSVVAVGSPCSDCDVTVTNCGSFNQVEGWVDDVYINGEQTVVFIDSNGNARGGDKDSFIFYNMSYFDVENLKGFGMSQDDQQVRIYYQIAGDGRCYFCFVESIEEPPIAIFVFLCLLMGIFLGAVIFGNF